jgi:tetratricopeptide (TPR) repeat protein
MSERLTRRELKKDEFLEGVLAAVTWAKGHILIAALVALAVVLAVTLGVRIAGSSASGAGDVKSERALATARAAFGTGGLPAGITALEEVRAKHGRSVAGREATYLLANALYESGDFAKAKTTYEEFLKRPLHDDLLVDGAKLGVAACLEEMGDLAGAVKAYGEVWTNGLTPGSRLQAALAAARCAEAQGAFQEAIQLYDGAIAAYPESAEATEARFAIERVRAAQAAGAGVAPTPQG